MNSLLVTKLIIVAVGVFLLTGYIVNLKREIVRLQKDVNYYTKTYLRKQGGTALWKPSKGMVNYDLRSFDAGLSWYAVREEGELGEYLTILGYAEDVYPGLMKHLSNMDALKERVEKMNKSMTLDNPEDIAFLKNVGFTITTNK